MGGQIGSRKFTREYSGLLDPGPRDLTAEKILKRMRNIHIGDLIRFDSMKECYTGEQVDRHSATIKATGVVVEHCGGYVMVKLRNGVLESVNYFDIESVNGHGFPGYIQRAQTPSALNAQNYERRQLWS